MADRRADIANLYNQLMTINNAQSDEAARKAGEFALYAGYVFLSDLNTIATSLERMAAAQEAVAQQTDPT